jgi:predicted PurR-regulated permease PerM
VVLSAVGTGIYFCFQFTLPFLTPLTMAIVLSILAAPLHRRVERKLKSSAMAATLTLTAVAFMVVVPLTFLIAGMVQEAAAGALSIHSKIDAGVLEQTLAAHPKIAALVARGIHYMEASSLASRVASWLTGASGYLVTGSVTQFLGALLTFYLLFYFLRDWRQAAPWAQRFLPFTEAEIETIFDRAADAVRAIIYGTAIMGVLKGVLGGIFFAVAGLPAPLFWGIVMGLLAILPVVGTGLIWIPATLVLALNGDWITAVVLAGAFIAILPLDTIVYPVLVGNRIRFHTVVVFISAAGGLIVFGPIGFILGPLIVAITFALWDVAYARYHSYEVVAARRQPPFL